MYILAALLLELLTSVTFALCLYECQFVFVIVHCIIHLSQNGSKFIHMGRTGFILSNGKFSLRCPSVGKSGFTFPTLTSNIIHKWIFYSQIRLSLNKTFITYVLKTVQLFKDDYTIIIIFR